MSARAERLVTSSSLSSSPLDTRGQARARATPRSGPGGDGGASQQLQVCVRVRPLTQKEVKRGDSAVWGVDDENNLCIVQRERMVPKYAFDVVYRDTATNTDIFSGTGAPVVDATCQGLNGTMFAYGVTSSGKTWTMMGNAERPGLVPQAMEHLFSQIRKNSQRTYFVKLSMLEIYNEVINDLFEPTNSNLRIREDAKTGNVMVQDLTSMQITTATQALSLIATGQAQRKVGATDFNAESSRSHTICRITVDACDTESKANRTLSTLNLIDLAGSESAKVAQHNGQRKEGSFINRSLLTLGAVISKLSEAKARTHIPFRDSKLTRLLQNSLSGSGARVAVVCCITKSSAQVEETHNTLKFATRAKSIKISVSENKMIDPKTQLALYQRQIMDLKQQLQEMAGTPGSLPPAGSLKSHQSLRSGDAPGQANLSPGALRSMHRQMLHLREELEEERQVLLSRNKEKEQLEERIQRLTKMAMTNTRALVSRQEGSIHSQQASTVGDPPARGDEESVAAENERLREHLRMMMEEMEARGVGVPSFASGIADKGEGGSSSATSSVSSSGPADSSVQGKLNVLPTSLSSAPSANIQKLPISSQATTSTLSAATGAASSSNAAAQNANLPPVVVEQLTHMEAHVARMRRQMDSKDAELSSLKRNLERIKELERSSERELRIITQENQRLRSDLQDRDEFISRLQGYGLDGLPSEDLADLIASLTQAVERVHIATQLHNIQNMQIGNLDPDTSPDGSAGGPSWLAPTLSNVSSDVSDTTGSPLPSSFNEGGSWPAGSAEKGSNAAQHNPRTKSSAVEVAVDLVKSAAQKTMMSRTNQRSSDLDRRLSSGALETLLA